MLGNNTFALRLPSAFAGVLTIATTFALGRRLLGERSALLGAGFVALTLWTVLLNHISYRANLLPALFPIWLYLFWRCRDRADLTPYVLAGIFLGILQYTYTAARFVPFLAVVLAIDWRHHLDRRGLLVGLVAAALTTFPLAIAIYLNPDAGLLRSQQVWVFSRPDAWPLFWHQLVEHLKMFGLTGDPIWLHNLPGRPPLSWFVAPFFLLGLLFAIRKAAPRALLWSVVVMLWPGILAVSRLPAVPPDHLRILVIAPPVFLLVGYGVMRLFGERRAALALLVGVALVLADGAISVRDLQQWEQARETYEQFDADMVQIAREIDQNPDTFYVVPIAWGWPWTHYWSIDFATNFKQNYTVSLRPYLLSAPPTAPRIGLVRWLAGMHADADPQRRLDAQLRLAGYSADGVEQGQTYEIEYYSPVAATRNRLELTDNSVMTQNGLTLTDAIVYCFRPEGAEAEQLAIDLTWQAPGPQPEDLSASVRLVRVEDGGTVAQVDAWLQNARGNSARTWAAPDSGTQFFELPDTSIPPGEYEVWAIPYETASTQALPLAGDTPTYSLGRVELPLCATQP